jgi:MFS family permease
VPDLEDAPGRALRTDHPWQRFRRLLRYRRVWLLAPTWIALNATIGLYTSQTLFQLVRGSDPRFPGQTLVGGFDPLHVSIAFVAGGVVFLAGILYRGRRFAGLRRTTVIFYGILGGALFVLAALLLNHSASVPAWLLVAGLAAAATGVFLIAGATPAALGLLADVSESFPEDRGAVMGLYSVFLALGQIGGAFIGAVTAEAWAFDGILVATALLLAAALVPLGRLRRFEFAFEPDPQLGPDPALAAVDLSRTAAYRLEPPELDGSA